MATQQPRQRAQVSYHSTKQPSVRRLPEEILTLSPLALQYEKLKKVEQDLDATITRKRYDMQDALNRPLKIKRTMRIWCSNTATDQAWQENPAGLDENDFDFENGSIPSWTLRLEGALLPCEAIPKEKDVKVQFTDLVRSVVIEEDKGFDVYSEGPILEYHRPHNAPGTTPTASLPGLEIKRKGDTDVQLKISLTLENSPERYKLQPKLAEFLDLQEATRQEIMSGLWSYVQAEKLQDTEEKRLVHADPALKELFNLERLFFPDLPKLINKLLLPCDPIIINYNVRVDKALTRAPQYWDIEVFIDSPTRQVMLSVLRDLDAPDPKIADLDASIASTVATIEQHLSRRAFFQSYAQDPVEFINAWLASQNSDMEVLMGEVKKASGEHARRAEFYDPSKKWLQESIFHYLSASLSNP